MKTTYLKAPFQFKQLDVPIPEIGEEDILLKIKACGFCGSEMTLLQYAAEEWTPFGHEIAGIVEKIGSHVKNVKVGDKVVVESSTFNPYSDEARNGQPELNGLGHDDLINYIGTRDVMGFSEYTAVPAALCVQIDKLDFIEGALIEPLGVAMDLFKTADIRLNDDVLVYGAGTIGLMVVQLAVAAGANVYVANRSRSKKKAELALQFGAKEVIFTDKENILEYKFPKGGLDKILVTAPPAVIPDAVNLMNLGGILAFIGISYGEEAMITLDSNIVHHKKMQIRASDAVPALYFPLCIDLVEEGVVDLKSLVTYHLDLDHVQEGMEAFVADPENNVKAVLVNE
ncbi:MAG TPA: alcohol dehydrogenase catalytic domain-containing protein [Clostridiaceae bacterium]|nr:alcohol dehydrogenase catalytic domain-containing protein [Clostridiaceae bacterium]